MNLVKKFRSHLKIFFINSVIALLVIIFITPSYAGVFSVTPVRIYMAPKDRAVAVTITNEGDTELVMQADLYLWKQKPDGQDDLTLTDDMFLAPPIIKMAPKSRQVVRLARLNPARSSEQLTYRLIVREIPEAKPEKKDLQLQIALAFSMPVFITPSGAKAQLNCTADRVSPDTIYAVCENTGSAYSHPTSIQLNGSAGNKLASNDVGGYILPHIKRSFYIKREGAPIAAGTSKLAVTFDDGTTETYNISLAN